ncbi:MAG: glycosyltransferase [bacterium]
MSTFTSPRPAISVVLTTYNGERYLGQTLDSILNQTFREYELIIVDDASTDSTPSILHDAGGKDPRIVLVRNEKNLGGTASLNRGLERARGRYIAIMDHDDISLPERLQKEFAFLEDHPDIFLVGTRANIIDERGKIVSTSKTPTDPEALARILRKRNPFYHPSIMFRNNGTVRYREKIRYVMDYDLYLRLLTERKRLANLPDVLLQYRLVPTSASLLKREQQELFARVSRSFFEERGHTGADSYERFHPDSILSVDPETSTDALVLREHAAGLFRANRFADTRVFCRKYFRSHGWSTYLALLYVGSFLGRRILTLKRKFVANV